MWCQWALRSYRDLTNPFCFHFPLFQRRYMPMARTHSSPAIPMYAPTARRPRRIPNRYVPPTEHKIIKQAPITTGNTASLGTFDNKHSFFRMRTVQQLIFGQPRVHIQLRCHKIRYFYSLTHCYVHLCSNFFYYPKMHA